MVMPQSITPEPASEPKPVSTTEPVVTQQVSTEPAAVAVQPTAPLTPEAVQKMIAEAVAQAVAQGKDVGRRELQAAQDRNRAELYRAERRAKLAETTLGATRSQIARLDPEVAKELELAELRAERQGRASIEQEEAVRQQREAEGLAVYNNVLEHLKEVGISPDDPRVDWANDTDDPKIAQARVFASAAKIMKENMTTKESALETRLKELESLVKKTNVEVNSVSTEASVGATAGSDADFMKKFGSGELPATKENRERYNKITNSY